MGTASDAPAGAAEEQQQPAVQKKQQQRTLVFTYGTLKRGFSNHPLLQDLAQRGDASFVGAAVTASRLPLVCGPYRVPFLLNLPGEEGADRVAGELYAVTPRGLERLDELEGVSRAHYERLPIAVDLAEGGGRGLLRAPGLRGGAVAAQRGEGVPGVLARRRRWVHPP
ncbi:unnamed protein product [Urochloa humidicola]